MSTMVEQILLNNTIDILCLQEVEVENGFDLNLSPILNIFPCSDNSRINTFETKYSPSFEFA